MLGHRPIDYRPQLYQLNRIRAKKVTIPDKWSNPYRGDTAPGDQGNHGYCVGFGTSVIYDQKHISLTGQKPTEEDRKNYKSNVKDSLGAITDVLYPQSVSRMGIYVKSRESGGYYGNEEGSDTIWAAQALTQWGVVPETAWHTGKSTVIWEQPQKTSDGGMSEEEATTYASNHRIDGYAMVGDENGVATFEEVCAAVYEYGGVLAGIPIYDNYGSMAGGDGWFPDPPNSRNIDGYHCLPIVGYDKSKGLEVDHSWGTWCARNGGYTKKYFDISAKNSTYLVILDKEDTEIGKQIYKTLAISAKDSKTKESLNANIFVDGVKKGESPLKIAVEPGKQYEVRGVMAGYSASKRKWLVSKTTKKLSFTLTLSLKKKKA